MAQEDTASVLLVNFETAGNYAPKLEINAHIFAMTRRRDVSKQLSL